MLRSIELVPALLLVFAGVAGCTPRHTAPVAVPVLPPLEASVRHSGRLWVELRGFTEDKQCQRPAGKNPICFARVHEALATALEQTTWASFPSVALRQKGDNLEPGDYVLLVELELYPVAPDPLGPGWSAAGQVRWKLVRDGLPVLGGSARSRSRADFAYGSPLGVAAGEVIGALGAHIAGRVSELPESHPRAGVPLPPVAVSESKEPTRLALSLRSKPAAARSLPGAR